MKLFDLVSISLAVFGGTFAALAALRDSFEELIQKSGIEAKSQLAVIRKAHSQHQLVLAFCDGYGKRIRQCRTVWLWSNGFPAVLYSAFSFALCFYVLIDWPQVMAKDVDLADPAFGFPWNRMKLALWVMMILDFVCIMIAAFTWNKCKGASKSLNEHYTASQAVLADPIKPEQWKTEPPTPTEET
jgi:hypothetical protein